MKKIILASFVLSVLIACNSSDKKTEEKPKEPETPAAETSLSDNPDYQKGLDLIAQSDCLTCHHAIDKINGPSYTDVANKYAGMPDTIVSHLAGKIISGGSGVWGSIPMTAHPTMPKEDAEAMVKYILLLKNN